MYFNSLSFLIFLPVVYLLYWSLSRRGQNILLILASYFFYACWDWRFLSLIVVSSMVDYLAGAGMRGGGSPGRRRAWLLSSLLVNLGLLGTFKYLDFGVESFALLLRGLGFEPHLASLGLILPVGISFYTFQTLSYTIDVYRRRIEPTADFFAFFAYVAFFPQLVAGPIERASHLLRQFLAPRRFDAVLAADGLRQMLYGFFLKMVIADKLVFYVDRVYGDVAGASGWGLLFSTYCFAFQIYGDFAGYSHIAIGCSRLFGFDLMRNFTYPYFARSPAEFWHRWHISLSTWFRDYVYVPLGGGRVPDWRRRLNILITFVVSGLWHGAGFTFVIWGFLHGLLVAGQWWEPRTKLEAPLEGAGWPRLRQLAAVFVMFHLACFGWVFFRAASLTDAVLILHRMAGDLFSTPAPAVWTAARSYAGAWFLLGLTVLIEYPQRTRPHGLDIAHWHPLPRRGAYFVFILMILLMARISETPFIYFQF